MISLTDVNGYTALVDDTEGSIAYITWDLKNERSFIAFTNSELVLYVQETPDQIQEILEGRWISVPDGDDYTPGPREGEEDVPEGEHCGNCLYEDNPIESLPCRDCEHGGGDNEHWEPADILDRMGIPHRPEDPGPGPLERAYDGIPNQVTFPQVFGPVVQLPLKRK